MYRDSFYDEILEIIKEKPKTQKEILELVNKEAIKISLQGIAKHLKNALEVRSIAYLGNKPNKKDAKQLIKKELNKDWPENAHQMYLATPLSANLHVRLMDKHNKNEDSKSLISEITELYRRIEVFSFIQTMEFTNKDIIRAWFKAKGIDYSDEYIEGKIKKTTQDVNEFYERRDKELDEVLKMSPIMYWIAFKEHEGENYNAEKSAYKKITSPMIEKIKLLINWVKI